jgi:hypothetical protein
LCQRDAFGFTPKKERSAADPNPIACAPRRGAKKAICALNSAEIIAELREARGEIKRVRALTRLAAALGVCRPRRD